MLRRQKKLRPLTLETLEPRSLLAGVNVVYSEDLETSSGGFTIDNTGGDVLGLWHYSIGRRSDGQPNHSAIHSYYYGSFETATGNGRFDILPFHSRGDLFTPEIMLPECGTLNLKFNYLLDTRPELFHDLVTVSVITSSGTTQILSRQDGTLPETDNTWQMASRDLTAFAGEKIQLRFTFDTVDAPLVDPEGWYIDDIQITNTTEETSISGYEFNDLNGNGIDDSEPRVAGVTVQLTGDTDGNGSIETISGVTDANGEYSFPDLAPGHYVVTTVNPGTYAGAPVSREVDLADGCLGSVVLPASFLGSLHGVKVHVDKDTPIAGITFNLTGDSDGDGNADVLMQTTDSTGQIHFNNLFPGTYVLTEIAPASLGQIPIERTFTVQSGEALVAVTGQSTLAGPLGVGQFESAPVDDLTLRNLIIGSIHGYVFNDVNGNGVDDNEPRVAGVSVQLIGDSDGDGTEDTQSVLTDANGVYNFERLYPGTYTVIEVAPGTLIGAVPQTIITIGSGEEAVAEAGLSESDGPLDVGQMESDPNPDLQLPNQFVGSIHGYVFNDLNDNGIDDGEPRLEGITVNLVGDSDGDGTEDTVSVTTDANGIYNFENLYPGTYTVVEVALSTTAGPPPQATLTIGSGEEAVAIAGQSTSDGPLGPGQSESAPNNNLKLANIFLAGIFGVKLDAQRGTAVAGLEIILRGDSDGDGFADELKAMTDSTGQYSFVDIFPGSYTVTETDSGTFAEAPLSINIDLQSGEQAVAVAGQSTANGPLGPHQFESPANTSLQFENLFSGSIQGYKFRDENQNGNDNSEPRWAGVTITLVGDTDNDGTVDTLTTVTDSNGAYHFDHLYPGSYTITETPPTGSTPTTPVSVTFVLQSGENAVPVSGLATNGTGQFEGVHGGLAFGNRIAPSTQTVQFISPQSVFRPSGEFAYPAPSKIVIGGYVWDDANGNGIWNAGEMGIDGVQVQLLDADENVLLTDITRSADLDGNGVINGRAEHGLYWFSPEQSQILIPNGDYLVRVLLPSGQTSSLPGATNTFAITISDTQTNVVGQAFQSQAPNFGLGTNFVANPPAGSGTIEGFVWNDIDQDGSWDTTTETAREGSAVFLDANGNGIFDPLTERLSITGADGKYVFSNVAPGTYSVLFDRTAESDGLFVFKTGASAANQTFTLAAGQVLKGNAAVPGALTIGRFDYVPYIRPADDFVGHLDLNSPGSYLEAVDSWQSFHVENTSTSPLIITSIDKDIPTVNGIPAAEFVSVYQKQSDGSLTKPSFPIAVAAGATIDFVVFYDPAIRDSAGTIQSQFPEWFGSEQAARPPHTFAAGDHLTVRTQFSDSGATGPDYTVNLVGGSTYDSDVYSDGNVDFLRDYALRLNQFVSNLQPSTEKVYTERIRIQGSGLSGTFKVGFNGDTTSAIPLTASASVLQNRLNGLSTLSGVTVRILGAPGDDSYSWEVTFNQSTTSAPPLFTLQTQGVTGKISIQEVTQSSFDFTSDVNTRFPNGSGGVIADTWPIAGSTPRQIALGDFGTFNTEMFRIRAPFLDLDVDNSSGTKGTGYGTEYMGSAVSIVDSDVRLANLAFTTYDSVIVTITNPLDGTNEGFDVSALPAGSFTGPVFAGGVVTLTLTSLPNAATLIDRLLAIKYTNAASSPTLGERQITIQVIGGADFASTAANMLYDQTAGNITTASINVVATPAATSAPKSLFLLASSPSGESPAATYRQAVSSQFDSEASSYDDSSAMSSDGGIQYAPPLGSDLPVATLLDDSSIAAVADTAEVADQPPATSTATVDAIFAVTNSTDGEQSASSPVVASQAYSFITESNGEELLWQWIADEDVEEESLALSQNSAEAADEFFAEL